MTSSHIEKAPFPPILQRRTDTCSTNEREIVNTPSFRNKHILNKSLPSDTSSIRRGSAGSNRPLKLEPIAPSMDIPTPRKGSSDDKSLEKAVKLITDKHSSQLFERQVYVINKLVENRKGFYIDEIPHVQKVIEYCIDQIVVEKREEFLLPLENILLLSDKNLLMKKTADNLMKQTSYNSLFSSIVQIFSMSFPGAVPTKTLAANTLCNILGNESLVDVTEDIVLNLLTLDWISSELIGAAQLSSTDPYVQALIKLIKQLTEYDVGCQKLAQIGIIQIIATFLNVLDFTDESYGNVIDILWNMLDLYEDSPVALGGGETIQIILDNLKKLISEGFRQRDKDIRNDLLVITSCFAQQEEALFFFKPTGFLDYLIYCSISIEDEVDPSSKFQQTSSEQDFEMKKLMWHCLFFLSFNDDCLQTLIEKGYIRILIAYLRENTASASTVRCKWNTTQMLELQLLILKILFVLSVRVPDEFVKWGGCSACLKFVENTKHESLFSAALSVLMNFSTTEVGTEELSRFNTIQIMLDVGTTTIVPMNCRCDCFHIISSMCGLNSQCKSAFVLNGGVAKMLPLLEVDKSSQGKLDDFLFVIINCIWTCIVGDENIEKEFIQRDGIHKLISMIESGSDWIRVSLLSCLIDLMTDNPEVIEEVYEWESLDTRKSFCALMIFLWQSSLDSNQLLEALKDETGELGPFVAQDVNKMVDNSGSRVDLSLKRKIYHIFRLLSFDRDYMATLSMEELISLENIKQYDEILVDQVWYRITRELELEGVRPTTPDEQLLEHMSRTAEMRAQEISINISNIRSMHRVQQIHKETTFYLTLAQLPKVEQSTLSNNRRALKSSNSKDHTLTIR